MDLETVIGSEVNEREKTNKLTHTCGIYKNGTGETICKSEIVTHTRNKCRG